MASTHVATSRYIKSCFSRSGPTNLLLGVSWSDVGTVNDAYVPRTVLGVKSKTNCFALASFTIDGLSAVPEDGPLSRGRITKTKITTSTKAIVANTYNLVPFVCIKPPPSTNPTE